MCASERDDKKRELRIDRMIIMTSTMAKYY
jgi:hypothetical protein